MTCSTKQELTSEEQEWVVEHADKTGWLYDCSETICSKLCHSGQGRQRKNYNGKFGIELRGQIYLDWQCHCLAQSLGAQFLVLARR